MTATLFFVELIILYSSLQSFHAFPLPGLKDNAYSSLGLRWTAPCNLVSRFCYFFSAKPRNCSQKNSLLPGKSLPLRPALICYTTPSLHSSNIFLPEHLSYLWSTEISATTALSVSLTLTTFYVAVSHLLIFCTGISFLQLINVPLSAHSKLHMICVALCLTKILYPLCLF